MKIRNPQPDGLIVSFDLDEVFVTGSQKTGDGLDDGIGSHRNTLRGHIHIGFEVALIAPENSPAARVETHMVAHRALGKRIVAVQPDQTARFDDPESIGRKHGSTPSNEKSAKEDVSFHSQRYSKTVGDPGCPDKETKADNIQTAASANKFFMLFLFRSAAGFSRAER